MSKRDPASRRTPAARGLTPESERKTAQVKLRLSPERAAKLRAIADAAGLDTSALVARWIDEAK